MLEFGRPGSFHKFSSNSLLTLQCRYAEKMMRTIILVATVVSVTGNCHSAAYTYCCEAGTNCDCSKSILAPGQCGKSAYSYWCGVGIPCICVGNGNSTDMKELVAQDVEIPLFVPLTSSDGANHDSSVGGIDIPLTSSDGAHQNSIASANEALFNFDFHHVGSGHDFDNESAVNLAACHFGAKKDIDSEEDKEVASSSGNCHSGAYAYCCGVGVPCDCSKGILDPSQCGKSAYSYCCGVGIPCICEKNGNFTDMTESVAPVV